VLVKSTNLHFRLDRDFFINRNYGGCDVDSGWLVVEGWDGCCCSWESPNTIRYSAQPTWQNWESGDTDLADVMVIMVR